MKDVIQARRVLAVVWVVAVLYLATLIDRGWGPPDEGLLGQAAERFLQGEVPHRDFDDLYTGGLTLLHGLAFKLFGVRLLVLRLVLLLAAALWIPALYGVTRRFASPPVAGLITALAVIWSIPAYPASMPSWYNLFLATAGLLAALRYTETERARWLVAAGACGGLSILAKITGIYFLGAIALFIVYRSLLHGTGHHGLPAVRATSSTVIPRSSGFWLGMAAALTISGAVLALLGNRATLGSYVQFAVPTFAVALLLAGAGWSAGRVDWKRLGKALVALGLGAAVVLVPFAVFFASLGALDDLVRGVFLLPARRLEFASRPPDAGAILWSLPLVGVAASSLLIRRRSLGIAVAGLVSAFGLWLLDTGLRHPGPGGIGGRGIVYLTIVSSVSTVIPIITWAYAFVTIRRGRTPASALSREQAFVAVAVTAMCALIAFPYSNDLYFHYVAPLICVAVLALKNISGRAVEPRIAAVTLAFYLVFGLTRVAVNAPARLPLERVGLRVPPADSAEVTAFVRTLRAHARNGYTYATPDSPEAYFLSGLRNPTRTMYEFLGDSTGATSRILSVLEAHKVTAVAISWWRIFSPAPDARLMEALRARYPDSTVVWHFIVRWVPDTVAVPAMAR